MIRKFARLEFELFTKPSKSDFLRSAAFLDKKHHSIIPSIGQKLNFRNTLLT